MYLIIGSGGFLGTHLVEEILSSTGENIICCSRRQTVAADGYRVRCNVLDVTDGDAVDTFCRALPRELDVIWLAASHNMDFVEEFPEEAAKTNITAPACFLERLPGFRSFYFASSDTVYGEGFPDRPFTESDELLPLSEYGRQKAAAEKLIVEHGGHALRFPFMLGSGRGTGKTHFFEKLAAKLLAGEKIELYTDYTRSALDYSTTAKLTVGLINKEQSEVPSVLNVCGDDALTKYELGVMLAESLSCPAALVVPVTADKSFRDIRASLGAMDNSLLRQTLGMQKIKINFGGECFGNI